jgi:hypothetical protein
VLDLFLRGETDRNLIFTIRHERDQAEYVGTGRERVESSRRNKCAGWRGWRALERGTGAARTSRADENEHHMVSVGERLVTVNLACPLHRWLQSLVHGQQLKRTSNSRPFRPSSGSWSGMKPLNPASCTSPWRASCYPAFQVKSSTTTRVAWTLEIKLPPSPLISHSLQSSRETPHRTRNMPRVSHTGAQALLPIIPLHRLTCFGSHGGANCYLFQS